MVNKIKLEVPSQWDELNDKQLYYLYTLICDNISQQQIQTFAFLKWTGTRVVCRYADGFILRHNKDEFYSTSLQLEDAVHALDWIDAPASNPVRLSHIGRYIAVDANFMDVPFQTYLMCENLYQGYLRTQDHKLLAEMGYLLYQTRNLKMNRVEKISIFYWFRAVKDMFARRFTNFFVPADNTEKESPEDIGKNLSDSMNAQIRALTKGDVTKEQTVLSLDTWRALTELDAIAKENQDKQNSLKKYEI